MTFSHSRNAVSVTQQVGREESPQNWWRALIDVHTQLAHCGSKMGKLLIAYCNHRTAAYRQPLWATNRQHLAETGGSCVPDSGHSPGAGGPTLADISGGPRRFVQCVA